MRQHYEQSTHIQTTFFGTLHLAFILFHKMGCFLSTSGPVLQLRIYVTITKTLPFDNLIKKNCMSRLLKYIWNCNLGRSLLNKKENIQFYYFDVIGRKNVDFKQQIYKFKYRVLYHGVWIIYLENACCIVVVLDNIFPNGRTFTYYSKNVRIHYIQFIFIL